MTKVVRLFRPERDPGDATGAFLSGGRWNNPGTAILYSASSLALACLEVLVHIRKVDIMPDLVYSSLLIPDDWIEQLQPVPDDWMDELQSPESWIKARVESQILSRDVGDRWIQDRRNYPKMIRFQPHERIGRFSEDRRPVLQVPSIIIPQEPNYLLDPEDAGVKNLAWSRPMPFRFDPRLLDPSLRG